MGTKIEWAEETWNPITGCSKISPGCDNCYAEKTAKRLRGRHGYPAENPFDVTFHQNRLEKPKDWRKPKMIFVGSMGDTFHEKVKMKWVYQILKAAEKYPWHKYLFLTKRPTNMIYALNRYGRIADNWWLGVTAENQEKFEERWGLLKDVPAKVKFVSVEPMLEPLFIDGNIDWLICGGETGHGARVLKQEWVRTLRDQCVRYGIPFMFKQWGQWGKIDGTYKNVGKRKSGRELDGEIWGQYP